MLKIFSVYDNKAKAFRQPFIVETTGDAVRAFTTWANDPNSQICKFPTDFCLFEHGVFDPIIGSVEGLKLSINLGLADQYVKKEG